MCNAYATALRENRNGVFIADAEYIYGNAERFKVKVDISIYGFGELISVTKDEACIAHADTLNDDDYYEETEDSLLIGDITIHKPFLQCLEQY